MPNYTENTCEVIGPTKDIETFKKTHILLGKDGNLEFQFNTIIPMPEILRDTRAGNVDAAFFALGANKSTALPWLHHAQFGNPLAREWFKEIGITTRDQLLAYLDANRPQEILEAKRQIEAQEQTGYPDWYEWRCAHWGTKWDSSDFRWGSEQPCVFNFLTAWSPPFPIFEKLATMYPTLRFVWKYEERGAWFAGTVICHEGKTVSHDEYEPEPYPEYEDAMQHNFRTE
jgi:hypothetical protein